jgi:hypothetical protein
VTTEQEKEQPLLESKDVPSVEKAPQKSPVKPAARKRSSGKKKPKQRSYDHIPIIIALLVIFSVTLFGIGIGLTSYLDSERAGIPACGQHPCPTPFSASQKGGAE